MKRFRMALFAMFAVALMAVTPLAAMGEGASAAGISMPEPVLISNYLDTWRRSRRLRRNDRERTLYGVLP
jgi:hypothetical protein